jgi:hypothetical protein
MGKEIAMAAKHFWTSFVDGLTGEGMFGDLRPPGSPTRMFQPEPAGQPLLVVTAPPGYSINREEIAALKVILQRALDEAAMERVRVDAPDLSNESCMVG